MENARTWMIATLGPASSDPEMMKRLHEAGVDIFRVNLSHGDRDSHRSLIRNAAESGARVMVDLPGPKVRIDGASVDLPLTLEEGGEIIFCAVDRCPEGDERPAMFLKTPVAWGRIRPGSRILVDDGNVEFVVVGGGDTWAGARVVNGGEVKLRKGVAFDEDVIEAPPVIPEDVQALDDLEGEPFEYVSVSFARTADCITGLRKPAGEERSLIAKIEEPSGVRNAEDVILASDGIMVARGDLGVATPLPALPVLQKRLIALANYHRKTAIVATQMLESMVERIHPTRAEVTDVANAVFDGADMVMLSAETAVGRHPLRAVEMLASIINSAEEAVRTGLHFQL